MTRAIGILLLSCACGTAAPPAGYYDLAVGKTGQELRAALYAIVSQNHTPIDYEDEAADAIRVLDEDPANPNNVWLLYAQRSEPKSNYDPGIGWNIEHLWPVSYGLTNKGPYYSDLHHLRAESSQAHSSRGNKLFDETNPADGCHTPTNAFAPLCSSDCDSWEPPVLLKGDVARALFYMDVRYETGPGWETNLMLTDILTDVDGETNLMGRLTTLIKWHLADPVSLAESNRNDSVYGYQHNRNPFVDHPEWVLPVFAPRLTIRAEPLAHRLHLCWPAIYSDASLEYSPSLGPNARWIGYARPEGQLCLTFVDFDFPRGAFFRLLLP